MIKMEQFKEQILLILRGHYDIATSATGTRLTEPQQKIIDRVRASIEYAWKNWDEDVIASYYAGDKPQDPNDAFIQNWIENEDFEAAGFDKDYLKTIFN